MSDANIARRTEAQVFFDGVDISEDIAKHLLSLTYTDSEDGEADDLQIKLEDSDGIWLRKWLARSVDAAVSSTGASAVSSGDRYRVTSKIGVNVREGAGLQHKKLGVLAYGAVITVAEIVNGWARINYSGSVGYVSAEHIAPVGASSGWAIGDAVVANGRSQYTSYGEGTPGAAVSGYRGKVTHLNSRAGVPYPIHVDHLGWFAEGQVARDEGGVSVGSTSSSVTGLQIRAAIISRNRLSDGVDETLDCGQFELDDVDASGPQGQVTIKATALPYSSQIRQTLKSKAWESTTLREIAEEMAAANGMACLFESARNPQYDRVEQSKKSDIAFLSKLCADAGLSLKATANVLVLFDQRVYESREPVRTVRFGDGSYTRYRARMSEANTQYASCRVSYTDPASGKSIEATVYVDDYDAESENNQQLEVTAKVASIAEAKSLAEKRLRLANKFAQTANFTLPGDVRLVAGVTILLEDFGAWSGKYLVYRARHSLGGSGYTTQAEMRKVLEGY